MIFKKIREKVNQIPEGKVATYGQVAVCLGLRDARLVGWALHQNKDPKEVPCHRVVNKKGKIAENYAFGGWQGQKKRLLSEGVTFKDKKRVDLKKHKIQNL